VLRAFKNKNVRENRDVWRQLFMTKGYEQVQKRSGWDCGIKA